MRTAWRDTANTWCGSPWNSTSRPGVIPSLRATPWDEDVDRSDQGDDPFPGEGVEGIRPDPEGRLGGVALRPVGPVDQVADLRLGPVAHVLLQQTDLTYGLAGPAVDDQPEPVTVLRVAPPLAAQPHGRFGPVIGLRIEAHDVGVTQHLGDEIKVVRCHLPELEPRSFEDRSHVTTRCPTTGESETPRVSLGAASGPERPVRPTRRPYVARSRSAILDILPDHSVPVRPVRGYDALDRH